MNDIDRTTTATHDSTNATLPIPSIDTLFLDRELCVDRYTPTTHAIFDLTPGDIGHPLAAVSHRLSDSNWIDDAQSVVDTLQIVKREVQTTDGRRFLMQMMPCRISAERLDGVVVTFVDISEQRKVEAAYESSHQQLGDLLDSVRGYAIFTLDKAGIINTWNAGAREIFGWMDSEIIGQHVEVIFTPEDRAAGAPEQEMRIARETARAPDERFHMRRDGTRFFVSGIMSILTKDDTLSGYVKICRDLTERNAVELQLRQSHADLEQRIEARTQELHEINEVRRDLLRKMVNAQEEERTRIAHELHDRTAQHLTTFIYSLRMIRQMSLPPHVLAILDELLNTARYFMDELHTLVQGLRPPLLDMLGLVSALQDYAQKWAHWSGIPAHVQVIGEGIGKDGEHLPTEIETTIYRIVQEALTNVARHGAGATQVTITLMKNMHEIVVMIEDNGAGFDVDALIKLPPEKRRLGLLGMQERAGLLNGALTIESQIGKGTVISLQIPLIDTPPDS